MVGRRAHVSSWALRASLVGLLVATVRVPAQGAAAVQVTVDATGAGAPLERVWAFHGYDEINYTTVPEGKALLGTLAAAHTAPVHVRSHFLLNTGDGTPALKWGSTNVYTADAAGDPVYDWALTDGIMDTVTGAGAFPFVEIAFMPQALSSHPTPYRNASTISVNGGCFYPPTDYTKWADLIRTWATHTDGRYPNVAASWLWELWNEPDSAYWHGSFDEYAKLYDYTEAALHEVLPNAQLGGPAVIYPGGDFLTQFLRHCATDTNAVTGSAGTRLDLVTFHAKGGTAVVGDHVELDLGNQLRLHRQGFTAVASFPQFKQTPIYITEADPDGCAACPASPDSANAYRNSTAYGAYEVAMMKHTLDLEAQLGVKLAGVLTWAFTFPGTPYFGGYRALATNGVNLPVLSAFKLLGRLAGTRLPLTSSGARPLDDVLSNGVRNEPDIDGMAAVDGDAIQVLLWNYHDDLVPAVAAAVRVAVKVPARFGATARVSHLRVDESHGDAYTAWVSQGMPATPSAEQRAALEQAMEPSSLVPEGTVAVSGGVVALAFDLPRFGVSLLTILPGADGSGGATPVPDQPGSGCACGVSPHGPNDDGATPVLAVALLVAFVALRGRGSPRVVDRRGNGTIATTTVHGP